MPEGNLAAKERKFIENEDSYCLKEIQRSIFLSQNYSVENDLIIQFKTVNFQSKKQIEEEVCTNVAKEVELAMCICNAMVRLHLFGIKSAAPTFPNAWSIS